MYFSYISLRLYMVLWYNFKELSNFNVVFFISYSSFSPSGECYLIPPLSSEY